MLEKKEVFNHHTQAIYVMQKHFGSNPFSGIEIGTAEGLLTKGLLNLCPNLTMIYAIDPYTFNPGNGFESGMYDQAWHDDRRNQAVKALEPYPGRYTHLCATSDDAVSMTPSEVDFVWIDGDHSSSQIIKDVKNYYPKVKTGGIFGGHDWDKAIRIVLETIPEVVMIGKDLTWWVIKD